MRAFTANDIWLDQFADTLGFGWLVERLSITVPSSLVYATVTIVVYNLGIRGYLLSQGQPPYNTENPYFLLQPLVLIGAVYGSHALSRGYDRAMEEMQVAERTDGPEPLLELVPSRLPWFLFIVGAGLQLVRAAIALPGYGTLDIVANFVVFPFVYTPIIAQFFAIYLSIQVLAPWRLARSDVGIHFYDPHGVGGLRPLGELIKKAYYYIGGGLVVYALITYAPFVVSEWSVTPFAGMLFTVIWLVSVATVGFAVFVLHRFMHREKRRKIRDLERELTNYVDDPWDVMHSIPDDKQDDVKDLRQRMDRISATNEYPATFSIWSQLLLSVAIPKAFQLLIAGV
jgi:hypothetical protein